MTTTIQNNAMTAIRAFIADLATGGRLLAGHVRDRRNGASSTNGAMRLDDLSAAEKYELGITRERRAEYTFRDEI